MGSFRVEATVRNLGTPERSVRVLLLVDTGAVLCQLPRGQLRALDIAPVETRPVYFGDGRKKDAEVGYAEFEVQERRTPALVMFGEEDAPALLGAAALESLGFMVDPVTRRLVPVDLPAASRQVTCQEIPCPIAARPETDRPE